MDFAWIEHYLMWFDTGKRAVVSCGSHIATRQFHWRASYSVASRHREHVVLSNTWHAPAGITASIDGATKYLPRLQVSFLRSSLLNVTVRELLQDAQLSQRDRAAGCVIVFAKSRTLELGDNDLRTL